MEKDLPDQDRLKEALLVIAHHPRSGNWGVRHEALMALALPPIRQTTYNDIAKLALHYDKGEFTPGQRQMIESLIIDTETERGA